MKQSWDAQKIWMKWLKVSKVSLSLFMLLESSEKTLQAMWAAARLPSLVPSVSSTVLLWKAKQHVGNRRRPHHKMTDSFARLSTPTGSHEPPNSPKSGVVLWGKKSLLQPTFHHHLWKMGFHCHKPATKPLFNCKHKLKQLQWANMHKDCTKMHKNGQKSFLIMNPSCALNLVIEELWFGELKMTTTIWLVYSQLL